MRRPLLALLLVLGLTTAATGPAAACEAHSPRSAATVDGHGLDMMFRQWIVICDYQGCPGLHEGPVFNA